MRKNLLSIMIFILILSVISCSQGYDAWHMGGWGHMMGWGGGIMWVVFLIILGVAAYLILDTTKRRQSQGNTKQTPLGILKERYAKGEITKEQFDQMKKDLES